MGTGPEEIRNEIATTRAELAADVDRLADRTKPSRIVQRRTNRVRQALHSARAQVMGTPAHTAQHARRQVGQAAGTVRDTASEAAGTIKHGAQQATEVVREAPEQAMRSTQGNPLAAGLIAFGAGLLAATLIPRTGAEQRAAEQLKDQVGDMIEPVRGAVRESAQRIGEEAKGAAQQAAQQLKETATEAAKTTGEQARDQAQQVANPPRSNFGS